MGFNIGINFPTHLICVYSTFPSCVCICGDFFCVCVFLFFFSSLHSEKSGLWHHEKGSPEAQIRVSPGCEDEANLVGGTGGTCSIACALLQVQKPAQLGSSPGRVSWLWTDVPSPPPRPLPHVYSHFFLP